MTESWFSYIGPLVGIIGLILTIWWKVEGKIADSRDNGDKALAEIAAQRLHTAENYVTKSGMKEIKDEILGAVSGIRDDVRHLATRIDGMHEAQIKNQTSAGYPQLDFDPVHSSIYRLLLQS